MRKYSIGNGITNKLGNDDVFSESDCQYCRCRRISEAYHTVRISGRSIHYCKRQTVANICKEKYSLSKKCYRHYTMCDAGSFFNSIFFMITVKFGIKLYFCGNESGLGNIKVLARVPQLSSSGIQRRYGFEYTAASWDSPPAFCEALP